MYSHIVSYYAHKARTCWALHVCGLQTPHARLLEAYQSVSRSGVHHLRNLDLLCDIYHRRHVI